MSEGESVVRIATSLIRGSMEAIEDRTALLLDKGMVLCAAEGKGRDIVWGTRQNRNKSRDCERSSNQMRACSLKKNVSSVPAPSML